MGRVCTNAEISTRPCAGSVFSREIKCKAGLPNSCLRSCNEKCPAYKAAERPGPSVSSWSQTSLVQHGVRSAVQSTPSQQTVSRASAVPSVPRGPCGTCGGAK
jgi:hypothetical protein